MSCSLHSTCRHCSVPVDCCTQPVDIIAPIILHSTIDFLHSTCRLLRSLMHSDSEIPPREWATLESGMDAGSSWRSDSTATCDRQASLFHADIRFSAHRNPESHTLSIGSVQYFCLPVQCSILGGKSTSWVPQTEVVSRLSTARHLSLFAVRIVARSVMDGCHGAIWKGLSVEF